MEKSNQFSKKQIVKENLKHILKGNQYSSLIILGIYVLMYIAIIFLPSIDSMYASCATTFSSELEYYSQVDGNIILNYIFSRNDSENIFSFIMGAVFAYTNFYFLFSKSSLTGRMSIAISRKKQYFNCVFYHLVILTAVITSVKLITLYFNYSIIGPSEYLFPVFFANLTQMLTIMIFGFFVVSTGAILSGSYVEWGVTAFVLTFIIKLILKAINVIFDFTLHGFDGSEYVVSYGANEITRIIRFFDPSLAFSDSLDNFSQFWSDCDTTYPANALIIRNIIMLVVLILGFVASGNYFSKHYKPENCRMRGTNKLTTTLSGVFVTLGVVVSTLFILRQYEAAISPNSPKGPFIIVCIITIIAGATASYIFSLAVTLKPKKALHTLKGAGIGAAITITIVIIGYSGCFGFSNRAPDLKEIDCIEVSSPFEFICEDTDNDYFHDYEYYDGPYINLKTDSDIKYAYNLNKQLSEETEKDSNLSAEIIFRLKNGTQISRTYRNVTDNGLNTLMKLWETDEVRATYEYALCTEIISEEPTQIPTDYQSEEGEIITEDENDGIQTYLYEENGKVYSLTTTEEIDLDITPLCTKDIYLLSKDNRLAHCNKSTDTFHKELRHALYKDICNMSAEDRFYPEDQLGVIGFSNPGITQADFERTSDTYCGSVFYTKFYITSKMTNTIKVLKQYDYYKHLDYTRKIEKAYTVDAPYVAEWYMLSSDYTKGLISGEILHSSYAEWDTPELREYVDFCITKNTSVDHLFYFENDIPFPEETEISCEKALKLTDEAVFAYNMGNSGKFLITTFEDGTYNILLLPQK